MNISRQFKNHQQTYDYTRNLFETHLKNVSDNNINIQLLDRKNFRDLNITICTYSDFRLAEYIIISLDYVYYCEDEPGRTQDDPYAGCQIMFSGLIFEMELSEENIISIINIINNSGSLRKTNFMYNQIVQLRDF